MIDKPGFLSFFFKAIAIAIVSFLWQSFFEVVLVFGELFKEQHALNGSGVAAQIERGWACAGSLFFVLW